MNKFAYSSIIFAIGLAFGLWWPQSSEPLAEEPKATQPSRAPRVVCTDVAGPRENKIDTLNTRLNWCEARLRALTAPRPTGRLSWPEGIPEKENPDTWSDQMDMLVEQCDIPGAPVVTDCEEYPCITLMRPTGDTIEGKALRDQIKACESLPPNLTNSIIEAAPVVVNCPDGRQEDALVISGFSEEGIAALYGLEEDESIEFSQYIVHAGRRVESALALWACE